MVEDSIDLVIFRASGRFFSIDACYVHKIDEIQPITPIPFVPAYIDGLISIEGTIVPQINFSRYLSSVANDELDRKLIIVVINDNFLSIKVDEVVLKTSVKFNCFKQIVNSSANEIEEVEASESEVSDNSHSQLVVSEFSYLDKTVLHLNADHFLDMINIKDAPTGNKGLLAKVEEDVAQESNVLDPYLVLALDGERFAFELRQIEEVFPLPEITVVPGAPREVLGIAVVRKAPLLILSADNILNNDGNHHFVDDRYVVVISVDGEKLGMVFDNILGVHDYMDSNLFQSKIVSVKASGILMDDDEQLTTLLKPDHIIDKQCLQILRKYIPETTVTEESEEEDVLEVLQVRHKNRVYA